MMRTTASVVSCRDTVWDGAYHCIRCQLSRHCETVHTPASVASCRVTPPIPHPELSCPWDSMEAATFPPHLSMGLHGGCQTSPLAIHGTPWKLLRFHHISPWDSMGGCHVSTRLVDSTSATRFRRHWYRTFSIQHVSKGRPKLR